MGTLEKRLESHLKVKHGISPLSTYLKEIVYGGVDGIVTTFAVVAGFTGAQSGEVVSFSIIAVLLFGLANLFADGTSMALGSFLSLRSEKDYYNKQKSMELEEIETEREHDERVTLDVLKEKGFSDEHAKKMLALYAENKPYWTEFMMQYEVSLPNPESENPFYTSLATFLSFIGFGFIPLIPYLLIQETMPAFYWSVVFTLLALTTLALVRWSVTRQHLARCLAETVLLGGLSASIAYVVGYFFRA